MISRRAMLQVGAVAGGVGIAGFATQRAGVLDDGLRAMGLRPHTTPDPRDVRLLAEASRGQGLLIRHLDAVNERHRIPRLTALRAVLDEQWTAVTDAKVPPETLDDPSPSDDRDTALIELASLAKFSADARADGALSAGSLAVAKVLAAMSAGLEQVAVAARRLA